ncbi:oxidoreductase family protein [Nocardioides cynanchi]|uniref:oxidoreductase family protein n=1 Tax=Nocardioides cynanchi TaxID=2558918 RepID=UPI001245E8BD|nr:oxidoreductase family protein [Nocardioides cynanchi]
MSDDAVDRDWLGAVLGVAVESVEVTTTDAFNSRTARLRVRYREPDVALPTHLVLKRNTQASWAVTAGQDEAAFYALARQVEPPGIVPSLASGVDERTEDSFVLLEDLSATHVPPVTRSRQIALDGVPEPGPLAACVTTLARHHAFWWGHPALESGTFEVGHWSRDAERSAAYAERRRGAWTRLDLADLGAGTRRLYDAVLAGIERHGSLWLEPRFDRHRNLTLGHGDAYFANFLVPVSDAGQTYLIDWQGPEVDHCGNDLANLLATFWTPEQRHDGDRELDCLRLYHHTLVDAGVADYTWDDLVLDYRSGLLYWLLVPVQDAADGSDPSYWRPKMGCLESAVRDWECLDLLT